MSLVHIEPVALPHVGVHSRVDREETLIILGIFRKLDEHLVVGRGNRADDRVVFVLASTDLGHIWSVVVAWHWH